MLATINGIPNGRIFLKFCTKDFFYIKYTKKLKIWLKLDKNILFLPGAMKAIFVQR